MAYTVAQVILDVRTLLDEQAVNGSGFTSSGSGFVDAEPDDAELDSLIRSRIEEARNFVLGGCDLSLLREDVTSRPGPPDSQGCLSDGGVDMYWCSVSIADVLRLVRVMSGGWRRAVSDFIPFDSKDYPALKDVYSTGTSERPACAAGAGYQGKMVVELYSWPRASDIAFTVHYVPKVALGQMENQNDVRVSFPPLQAALRYYLAGLVCQTLKDERADNFIQLATTQMGITGAERPAGG